MTQKIIQVGTIIATIPILVASAVVGYSTKHTAKHQPPTSMVRAEPTLNPSVTIPPGVGKPPQEAVDAATALHNETWLSVLHGGLVNVAEHSSHVRDDRRSDLFVPAVWGMERSAQNSTGVFVGGESVLTEIIAFSPENYPVASHATNHSVGLVLCAQQTERDVRYVAVDGDADRVNGASSWIVVVDPTDEGWRVVGAQPQDHGCNIPKQGG